MPHELARVRVNKRGWTTPGLAAEAVLNSIRHRTTVSCASPNLDIPEVPQSQTLAQLDRKSYGYRLNSILPAVALLSGSDDGRPGTLRKQQSPPPGFEGGRTIH